MSVKKLLCGAALASLMVTPSVSALDITIPAANVVELAEELDFASDNVQGILPALTVTTTTALPVADDYLLTVTLSGGAVLQDIAPTVAAVLDTAGTTVISGQIVSDGGNAGDTTVSILFDVDTSHADGVELNLPITVNSCDSDVSVSINLQDNSDNPIEGGDASLVEFGTTDASAALTCVDAYQLTFADDGEVNQLSLASDFEQFITNVGNTGTTAEVGDVTVAVDTSAVLDDLTTNAAAGDIDTIDFEVVLADATGVDDVEITGAASATVSGDDTNSPVFAFSAGTVAVGTSKLTVDVDGTVEIAPQQINVQNASIVFSNADLVDEAATITGFGADSIDLEGASFGPFDWVGDATKPGINVFRGTGFDAADVPGAVVTLSNSSDDAALNATYDLDLTGKVSAGGELIILPADIQTAVGSAYNRADVTFTFFTSETIDVDRLISTNGVVSAYGNSNVTVAGGNSTVVQGDD